MRPQLHDAEASPAEPRNVIVSFVYPVTESRRIGLLFSVAFARRYGAVKVRGRLLHYVHSERTEVMSALRVANLFAYASRVPQPLQFYRLPLESPGGGKWKKEMSARHVPARAFQKRPIDTRNTRPTARRRNALIRENHLQYVSRPERAFEPARRLFRRSVTSSVSCVRTMRAEMPGRFRDEKGAGNARVSLLVSLLFSAALLRVLFRETKTQKGDVEIWAREGNRRMEQRERAGESVMTSGYRHSG